MFDEKPRQLKDEKCDGCGLDPHTGDCVKETNQQQRREAGDHGNCSNRGSSIRHSSGRSSDSQTDNDTDDGENDTQRPRDLEKA